MRNVRVIGIFWVGNRKNEIDQDDCEGYMVSGDMSDQHFLTFALYRKEKPRKQPQSGR